ncbi:hypothetical protein AgCh_012937 [Apium graveolens]
MAWWNASPIASPGTLSLESLYPLVVKLVYGKSQAVNPPEFKGSLDPIEANVWLKEIEKSFSLVKVKEEQKVEFASYYLKNEATYWWETVKTLEGTYAITWERFKELFLEKYFPQFVQDQMKLKFLELKQGSMSVADYERKVAIFELDTYAGVVQKAIIAETESEMSQKEKENCQVCGKKHGGVCNKLSVVCFKCNQKGHYSRECRNHPSSEQVSKDQPTRNPTVKVPAIGFTCFKSGKPGHIARDCKTPAPVSNALRIMGSTPAVNETPRAIVFDMSVKDSIQDTDVVEGMDWLSKHDAQIDCHNKKVIVKTPDERIVTFKGQKQAKKFLTMIQAKRLLRQGCEHFIAYVIDRSQEPAKLKDIPVVNEFPDVFPDELPGLPLDREIKFAVDLAPGTEPVSKAP